MKVVLAKSKWNDLPMGAMMGAGWGNGYVVLPKGHFLEGVHYDDIDVDVHGGLTFSDTVNAFMVMNWEGLTEEDLGCWCVGFDTAHYMDNLSRWPKQAVLDEANRLKEQLENYKSEDHE
jgi:hypothetical protein